MDPVDLTPATKRLAELIRQVTPGDLDKPTPCPAYTVGDLLDHIGGLSLAFTAAATKQTDDLAGMAPSGDASRLGEDWQVDIPRDLDALAAAWRTPDAWTGDTKAGGMDMPAQTAGLVAADELVVHGWDLARATGQSYELPPELLVAAHEFLSMFASPDAPAGPTVAFGPARSLPDDAPAFDKVVAKAGRDPGWRPG